MFRASKVLEPAFQEQPRSFFWQGLTENYQVDEAAYLKELIPLAQSDASEHKAITDTASSLIGKVRAQNGSVHMIDALLQEYSLDTQEGILLMCLAEALMRIPDKHTADALIRDKMLSADWEKHVGRSESTLVNASTWGLMLTGRVVKMDKRLDGSPSNVWNRLVKRSGEPVIRGAMNQAMAIMGKQFVLGRDINEALKQARDYRKMGYSYSFDMLGEAAMAQDDADRYLKDYLQAIEAVGNDPYPQNNAPRPSISIKLSALHPRYEVSQEHRVLTELYSTVCDLVQFARDKDVSITIDAEEMDRLELSLKLFEKILKSPAASGWGGFGLVIQAYSKRALPALCWLTKLAKETGDEIPIRLVKGAYWDTEIKMCQQMGIESYPVFTRKEATDTSYLACLRFLLSDYTDGALYPQLASHNAHTVAAVLAMAKKRNRKIEFQRLHGMGDALYNSILQEYDIPVRIYAPVGAHKDLLPYLVRRLLENGANSSFVHRLVDAGTPIEDLVQNPVQELQKYDSLANSRIPGPMDIFGEQRRNSRGINIHVASQLEPLINNLQKWNSTRWHACPVINGERRSDGDKTEVRAPYDKSKRVGDVVWADEKHAEDALKVAFAGFRNWNERPVEERALCLEKFANLMEKHMEELMALCCQEAGKTMQDGIDEVREAVDFCRYYANDGRARFAKAIALPGPTGESNELYMEGRGVFLCISPWNFPLAIYTGQIMAALVAGNTVIAKPAEQTSLVAMRGMELMLEAGFPANVLQFLPGDGARLGRVLTPDSRIAGVCFTGSTQVAHFLNRTLAERSGAIVPLIAETGGQNAMIVDSSALPEQVVRDVVQSAFASAGQRCSALRVLYVQQDVADRMETLLAGAMNELVVGNPQSHSTDVGPVIDQKAKENLEKHLVNLEANARLIGRRELPSDCSAGYFVVPSAYGINSINDLDGEHFGPILHVVRYKAEQLDKVIDEINATGYGLTLGIHSRSESTAAYIERRVKVGNCYVNRNQIGAVVGVQPFGGRGLSGTGPKAGGPHYVLRFATERTRTIDTTAVGGNASLLSLGIEKV
ncbi:MULTISPECIES: bifunctional proline dehydrogenase/L-glutamate gamma-semialdehyde dehydrogenase PutA [unclassified Marinobacter]|uniref:bifunctional proline dehydrogenase/L-glutamate gamma-semialdehyde dehydrogenase PutA n=1 Tax=unclassified Marinobacter TaxID=83889 RepID=UPI00200E771F|nr:MULTISPECIES: bifunctional proline dehydrogenase/L-glutamate gamma-semialdehyde dehydrogenase PutA [unclassified Marinobacter]UQG54380.1 bifunctional proline dehydrogenase/L-glutamate gamma-semialdehyde dehydrogenase PutA [Marinobacter sp. M4C]UQG63187.1 bifunctional proline dehydrogenase/L-glutamate gamma-semialdehyde dehydrogenase PutA [Marinobacter sp. M2C]UQG67465.1 bifunctional proline dehydrogenase/L-glutamate gamma-semialdehyde dehydrogenase PutA [Marinobacter sp. M1C]